MRRCFYFIFLVILVVGTFCCTGCGNKTPTVTGTTSTSSTVTTSTITSTHITSSAILSTTTTTTITSSVTSSDADRDGIDDSVEKSLIQKFAPVVKINPEEQYLPATITWFLTRVRMRFDVQLGIDKQILDKGKVTLTSLITQTYDNQSSGLSSTPTNFFLEATDAEGGGSLDNYRKETRKGIPSGWICYARVHMSTHSPGCYEIQYIFYYPYNGDTMLSLLDIAHESDFEHITILVQNDLNTISQIYFAAHDNEGKWYKLQTASGAHDGFSINEDGRPIVYAALNSHASYPWAGAWQRNNLPDDHTAGDGPIWDCLISVLNVGESAYPGSNMQWIQYSGHWGEIGTESFTTGPLSPPYQSWWNSDPDN